MPPELQPTISLQPSNSPPQPHPSPVSIPPLSLPSESWLKSSNTPSIQSSLLLFPRPHFQGCHQQQLPHYHLCPDPNFQGWHQPQHRRRRRCHHCQPTPLVPSIPTNVAAKHNASNANWQPSLSLRLLHPYNTTIEPDPRAAPSPTVHHQPLPTTASRNYPSTSPTPSLIPSLARSSPTVNSCTEPTRTFGSMAAPTKSGA